jgi:hypothetical protein
MDGGGDGLTAFLQDGSGEVVGSALSDDGVLDFGKVFPGRYLLLVLGERFEMREGSVPGAFPLDLGPEERIEEIVLRPGGEIRIRVTDAAGMPVEGARIAVKAPGFPRPLAEMASDRRGVAVLTCPYAGGYHVEANAGSARGEEEAEVDGGDMGLELRLK